MNHVLLLWVAFYTIQRMDSCNLKLLIFSWGAFLLNVTIAANTYTYCIPTDDLHSNIYTAWFYLQFVCVFLSRSILEFLDQALLEEKEKEKLEDKKPSKVRVWLPKDDISYLEGINIILLLVQYILLIVDIIQYWKIELVTSCVLMPISFIWHISGYVYFYSVLNKG
jgi:hypothetical protein